ncbi:hypothetical protein HCUR_01592 [Holospora curviuscula]|uniref:Uncharacterized protein n=1 Tax=Holospora curviuscula TaxID=1082868 RepID=A0A2S5R705_9PROT|nr:hypothetical protein HCUR_01592 [Holospora curviuscula]
MVFGGGFIALYSRLNVLGPSDDLCKADLKTLRDL